MKQYSENCDESDWYQGKAVAPSCNDDDENESYKNNDGVCIPFVLENLTDQGWLNSDEPFEKASKNFLVKTRSGEKELSQLFIIEEFKCKQQN